MCYEERYDQQEPAQREDCRREHLTPHIQDSSPPRRHTPTVVEPDLSGFGEGSTLTANQELRKAGKELKAITDCEAIGLGRIPLVIESACRSRWMHGSPPTLSPRLHEEPQYSLTLTRFDEPVTSAERRMRRPYVGTQPVLSFSIPNCLAA